MRAMMKSWREASSSRASTLLVSTWMLISMRGYLSRIRWIAGTASSIAGAVTEPRKTDAALAALQVGDLAVDLAHLEQHRARAARQRLAGRRQRHAARQPLAQLDAEYVLHLGDHARGSRLRDVEDLGGRADLAMIVERHDHPHVAELQPAAQHPASLSISWSIRLSSAFMPASVVSRQCPAEPLSPLDKIYQYCHIKCWKTHLTVISIPYQRPPVTSVGRRAAVPRARREEKTPAAVGESYPTTKGDCRFRDAGACARACDTGRGFHQKGELSENNQNIGRRIGAWPVGHDAVGASRGQGPGRRPDAYQDLAALDQ